MDKEIKEALSNYEQSSGTRKRDIGEYISYNAVMWLTSQQQQIEHHKAIAELAVKALEEIEKRPWDGLATLRIVNTTQDQISALSSIQRLTGGRETP